MSGRIRIVRKPGTAMQPVRSAPAKPKRLTVHDAAAYARPLKLLTIKEAATFAKVSTQTVRRWIKVGLLKIYRAGRQIRIDESDLVNFLSSEDLKWL